MFTIVHPYLGKIPILTNIFGMGWNHKLVVHFENVQFLFWLLGMPDPENPPKAMSDLDIFEKIEVAIFNLGVYLWKKFGKIIVWNMILLMVQKSQGQPPGIYIYIFIKHCK